MILAAMIKIPWLHYRGGYWILPPMLGGHRKTVRKLIIVASLGWQERQSLSPLE